MLKKKKKKKREREIVFSLQIRLAVNLILTKIEVVGIEQELRKVEELRNEFLHISHVVFGSREPTLSYAVKHSVGQIKMSSLKTQNETQI